MYCPCGTEIEDGIDYFGHEQFDEKENLIGFVCIHGILIRYGE